MGQDNEQILSVLREINQNLEDLRNILVNSLDPMTRHGLACVIREGFRTVEGKLDFLATGGDGNGPLNGASDGGDKAGKSRH